MGDNTNIIQSRQSVLPPSTRKITMPPVNKGSSQSLSSSRPSGPDRFSSVNELIEMQKKASEDPNSKLNTIRNKFRDISTLKKINIMVKLPIGKLFTDVSENLAKKDGLGDLKYNEKEHVFQRNGDTGKYSYMPGAFAYYSGGKITTKSGEVIDRPMSVSYDRGKTWTKVSEEPPYVEDIRALKLVPTEDGKAFRVAVTKKEGESKAGLYFLNYVCKGCDPNGIIYYEGVKRKDGSYLEPPQNYRKGKWEIKDSRVKQPREIYQFIAKYGLQKTSQHNIFSNPLDNHTYYGREKGGMIIIGKDNQGKKKVWIEDLDGKRKVHPQNALILKHDLTPKLYGGWKAKGYPGTVHIQVDNSMIYQGAVKGERRTAIWDFNNLSDNLGVRKSYRESPLSQHEESGYVKLSGYNGKTFVMQNGNVAYFYPNGEGMNIETPDGGEHKMPLHVFNYIRDQGVEPRFDGTWKKPGKTGYYKLKANGNLYYVKPNGTYYRADAAGENKDKTIWTYCLDPDRDRTPPISSYNLYGFG